MPKTKKRKTIKRCFPSLSLLFKKFKGGMAPVGWSTPINPAMVHATSVGGRRTRRRKHTRRKKHTRR